MVIDLAPAWKNNLALTNPIIVAAGGLSPDDYWDASSVGAMVTLPVTRSAHAGATMPRVVELSGGLMLRTGAANPGIRAVLDACAYYRVGKKNVAPIIIAFASQAWEGWRGMAIRAQHSGAVDGIELHLNPTIDAAKAVRAVRAATELPILAKLDLDNVREIAADCVAAGANALVIGRAPRAMTFVNGAPWYGRLFSPAIKAIVLRVVAEIAALNLNVPLVACGGVHSFENVQEFLAAGACAVEIDSAEWVEPGIAARIAATFR